MARRGGERVEKFNDTMALVRILQNDLKGHKMPFLMNFINTGPVVPRRYVLSVLCVRLYEARFDLGGRGL